MYPAEYPTAVLTTPGSVQNLRSAPQKQPMPNTAVSVPAGNGGRIGAGSTKWRGGTGIGVARPGSASSGRGMRSFASDLHHIDTSTPEYAADRTRLPREGPTRAGTCDRVARMFAVALVALLGGCTPSPPSVERRVDDVVTQRGASLSRGALTVIGEGLDDAVIGGLVADARVTTLTDLGLADNALGAGAVRALLDSPKTEGLRALDLSGNPLGDGGVATLAESPHLATVETLLLARVGATGASVSALAASPHATALRQLDLGGNLLGDAGGAALAGLTVRARLAADDAGIGGAGVRALLEAANVPRLSLAGNPVGAGGLAGLTRLSPAIVELSLAGALLGPGDAVTLAAIDAPGLRRLSLRGNALGDEGVRAVANAPWFARLTHLDVSDTGAGGATLTGLQEAWGDRGGLTARAAAPAP